tara:strand:- start:1650 stop:2741 length:1092 start_codon:yes stop_codon:yes gene_type:complete
LVDNKKIIDTDDDIIIEATGVDHVDVSATKSSGTKLSKRTFIFSSLFIFVLVMLISGSVVYYTFSGSKKEKTLSEELIKLSSIVRILQADLNSQKLENAELNKKISSINNKFKDTNSTLSNNKILNKDMFDSLSNQISKVSSSVSEKNTFPGIDEISIVEKTNELRDLEERLKVLSADIEKRIALSEEQNKNLKIIEEFTSLKENIMVAKEQIRSGKPFEKQLFKLSQNIDFSEDIRQSSVRGVVPVENLRSMFPQLARDTLSAIHQNTEETDTKKRFILILQENLGVRSLVPRLGDNPDAILSRVEALIKADNFTDALVLLRKLPQSGTVVLSEWIKQLEDWIMVNDLMTELDALLIEAPDR